MIISRNRIAAASCILPMSQNLSIPKELGMRHRAGLGLTEKTDALVIVVSEETGAISIMKNGNVYHDIQPDVLLKELSGKLDSLDVVSPASSFAKEQG
jgi:diadenylate cyclase